MLPSNDHAHPVGERGRVFEVVGDEHRGQACLANHVAQLGADGRPACGHRAPRRLVEEQDGGIPRQRPRERHALTLAAGQRRGPRLGEVRDP